MEDHIHLVTIFRHTVLLYSNFNIASQCNLRKIFIIRIIDSTNYFLNISRIRSSRVSSGRTPVVYPQIFPSLYTYILCNLFRYININLIENPFSLIPAGNPFHNRIHHSALWTPWCVKLHNYRHPLLSDCIFIILRDQCDTHTLSSFLPSQAM